MAVALGEKQKECPLIRRKSKREEREICLNCPLPCCLYERGRLTKAECGRLGGLVTKQRHGLGFFSINGARGGRPRALTIEDINRQHQLLEAQNNKEEVMDTRHDLSLTELRKLWRSSVLYPRSRDHHRNNNGRDCLSYQARAVPTGEE